MGEKTSGPQSYFPSIEKTYGKPVDHWFGVLEGLSGSTHMQMVGTLKASYGLGHGHANALVAYFRSKHSSE